MKFEVQIDDALVNELSPSIAKQLGDDVAKRERLTSFAVGQVINWMAGRTAYQSLTVQYTEWLMELLPLFYEEDVPTPGHIFNNFSVPYGRAAYISRVLMERERTAWRKRGKTS